MPAAAPARQLSKIAALVLVAIAALQVTFAARIALMAVIDPKSTAFQRSEAWRLLTQQRRMTWSQAWRDDAQISVNLKRAVIASEDAGFVDHAGVEWDAIEQAWERNRRAEQQAQSGAQASSSLKVVGGSTISQQLAKNLFLSGERTLVRKGQELLLTWILEGLLSKQRILEVYLNHVEWGEGLFGAQAAARRHFNTDASRLSPVQAARLAVMLPAPRRFERHMSSPFLQARAAAVLRRRGAAEVP